MTEKSNKEIMLIDCTKNPEVYEFMNFLTVQVGWQHLTLEQAHDLGVMATIFHFQKMKEAIEEMKTNCEHDGRFDKVIEYVGNGQIRAVCLRCKENE